MILQMLQAELMVECKTWNPLAALQFELPAAQAGEVENHASELTVAIGAATAAF
jgi:hypothetical protein